MSYDIDFWKYKAGVPHDNDMVYAKACCEGETLKELEALPTDKILKKIEQTFSDWTKLDEFNYEKEGGGAFAISITSQTVRSDCYGMEGDDMNTLTDILIDFGCPMYDPQISERFDSWTDR